MTGFVLFLAGFLACVVVLALLGRWIIRSLVG